MALDKECGTMLAAVWICPLASAMLCLLVPVCACLEVNSVGVLATGQVLPNECPLRNWLKDEPGFRLILVPTKGDFTLLNREDQKRMVRLYFPRTRDELVRDYSFIVFVDADISPYTARQLEDMRYAVGEAGSSALATLGGAVFAWGDRYGQWASSVLADIFPHDFTKPSSGQLPSFKIEVDRRADLAPVLKMFIPLGIESVVGKSWGVVYPKEGSTVWAWVTPVGVTAVHGRSPFLVSMPYGSKGALTWCAADDLDGPWWSSVYEPSTNEYPQDVFLNVLHYSLGHDLPDDILVVHDVRIKLSRYQGWRTSAIGMLEFLERFRAPSRELLAELASMDSRVEEATARYVLQEYREAGELMESLLSMVHDFDAKAMKEKDRALLWIYVTEWVAVTGTLLVGLTLIQVLMVKRSLYRRVQATRFG